MSYMEKLFHLLQKERLTISAAESLTAGLFQSELAQFPGASDVLKGGVVTYTLEAKNTLLDVPYSLLNSFGPVSKECAMAMVKGIHQQLDTSIAVSLTGAAGPTSHGDKDAGSVYIGIITPNQSAIAFFIQLEGSRNEVRQKAVENAAKLIIEQISLKN